MNNFVLIKV